MDVLATRGALRAWAGLCSSAELLVTADLAGPSRPQLETLCCLLALWLHESNTVQLKQKPHLKPVTLSPESPVPAGGPCGQLVFGRPVEQAE